MPKLNLDLTAAQIEDLIKQLRYGKYTAESFDIDLLRGLNGEVEALDVLTGKLEVKTDFMAHKTGNLAIEIECNGKPSGIQTSTANWWLFNINYPDAKPVLLIMTLSRLRKLVTRYLHKNKFIMGGDYNKSKLVLIPVQDVIDG